MRSNRKKLGACVTQAICCNTEQDCFGVCCRCVHYSDDDDIWRELDSHLPLLNRLKVLMNHFYTLILRTLFMSWYQLNKINYEKESMTLQFIVDILAWTAEWYRCAYAGHNDMVRLKEEKRWSSIVLHTLYCSRVSCVGQKPCIKKN